MKRRNLYYAQLGEAIKLAQSPIFEYKRISLILLDNIVENLLITQNIIRLHYKVVLEVLKRADYDVAIDSFNRFESIIKCSYELDVINLSEKKLFDFCHKTRNSLYHSLYADKGITEFCIIYYCMFLEKRFADLIEIGVVSNTDEYSMATKRIVEVEQVLNLEDILLKVKAFNSLQDRLPQNILADIIEDYIFQIEDAMSNELFDTYDILNDTVKYFYYDFFNKRAYTGLNPCGKIKQWYVINEKKIDGIKQRNAEIRNAEIAVAFNVFLDLIVKTEPAYIGLMLYYNHEEYEASLYEC